MSKEAEKKSRQAHSSNMSTEANNPCLREHKASLKCLDKNNYDRDKCEDHFANYNACMGFWNKIQNERRKQGIVPWLPPVEERPAIVKERFG